MLSKFPWLFSWNVHFRALLKDFDTQSLENVRKYAVCELRRRRES